jgi:hypothetical protein
MAISGSIPAASQAATFTTKDNNKWYLVMNATKDGLKAAPGYKYDKGMTTWVPDTK